MVQCSSIARRTRICGKLLNKLAKFLGLEVRLPLLRFLDIIGTLPRKSNITLVLRDKPGAHSDFYHTNYCLLGLAVAESSYSCTPNDSPHNN
ncbi:ANL_HP_G0146570.mRNA.1.CDS.1 [Saccharomyces cerevisiae]|nr:ANL_HP_G0146570.mRNA.1.CDS.1 [Saccharomyces cerevisiae]CAI7009196.1 ANL_HP_G0146570.mRNA.1.CDS.1 [Saccharomyces cerevisiae]